jgi:hypothetical protein
MNLSILEQQLQNNIIMYQRPTYKFTKELKEYSEWYDGEDAFHEENKIRWVLDAIKLKREIQQLYLEITFYRYCDIAGNII